MHPVDNAATVRKKGHHLAIASIVQLLVEGLADEKQRSRSGRRLPPRPGPLRVDEAQLEIECSHHWPIEREGAIEIGDTDEDV
jgi:hypothetical protein